MAEPVAYTPEGTPLTDEQLNDVVASGQARFRTGQPVHFVDATGAHYSVPGERAWSEIQRGARPLTAAEFGQYQAQKETSQSYGEMGKTAATGLARSLTFGLSDPVLESIDPEYAENERRRQEAFPQIKAASEITGYALPIAGAAGLGGRVVKGLTAAPRALSRVAVAAGEGATKGLGRGLAKTALRGTVEGAIEGAGFGAQQTISEHTIHDEPITASRILFDSAAGALLGGTLGALGGAVSKGAERAREQLPAALTRRKPALTGEVAEAAPAAIEAGGKPPLVDRVLGRVRSTSHDMGVEASFKSAGFVGSDIAKVTRAEGVPGAERMANRIEEAGIAFGDGMPQVVERFGAARKATGAEFERISTALEDAGVSIDATNVLTRLERDVLNPLRESGLADNRALANRIDSGILSDFRKTVRGNAEEFGTQLAAREKQLLDYARNEVRTSIEAAEEGIGRRELEKLTNEQMRLYSPQIKDFARRQLESEIGAAASKPQWTFDEIRAFRRQIDQKLEGKLRKGRGELTEKERILKDIRDTIEKEVGDQIAAKATPELARSYTEAKLAYGDWKLLEQLAKHRAGIRAGNRFVSLTDTITGGIYAGAGAVMAGPIGALTGLVGVGLNKGIRSMQAARIGAKVARKIAGDATELSTPVVLKEAAEAPARLTTALTSSVSQGRFSIAKAARAVAYQVPIATTKGTVELLQFARRINESRDQLNADQATRLARLSGQPGLQEEIALTQARAMQVATEMMPRPDQPLNPSLGDEQPPPPESIARDYAEIIGLLDQPAKVLEHFNNGTLTRQHMDVLNHVLPELQGDLQKSVLVVLAKQISQGKTPSYQSRLRMGLLSGMPVDPSDTPEFTATVQTMYGAVVPPPKARPRSSGSARVAERRQTKSERIDEDI